MTITGPDARSAAPGQAVVDAAMLVLERMGLTPADLLAAPKARPAIRHAQGAGAWGLAARLLADHWPGLHLGGQAATVHVILAGFPAGVTAADAELATVAAADELAQGSLQAGQRYPRAGRE